MTQRGLRLLLIQRVLPVYREPLFEALREQAIAQGHHFDLWVSPADPGFIRRGTTGGLPWARSLPVYRLGWKGVWVEWQSLPWRELLAADVVVVPDAMRCLSHAVVILWRRWLGKPVLTWGHGANFQPARFSHGLEPLRHGLLRAAQGHLLYTETCRPLLLARGYPAVRLRVVGNAVDLRGATGLHPGHPEVLAFRAEAGLGDDPCIAFLGSWYPAKQPERILAIGRVLRERAPNARVLVIGDGDGDGLAALRAAAAGSPWLSLLGPLQGRRKFVALAAARALAVTGIAGLNLLDAMAVGLPVVLPARSDHSPEVAYVRHDGNGLIVADHPAAIAAACVDLLLDENRWASLGRAARETVQACRPERVATNLLEAMLACGLAGGQRPSGESPSPRPIVFLCQRLLPYHRARFRAVSRAFARQGQPCVAVQVTAYDRSYGAIDAAGAVAPAEANAILTLFPDQDYLALSPRDVTEAVRAALATLGPDTIFTPAPAFAEGAGAVHYKARHACRLILMDDAWHLTDRRGWLTFVMKYRLYRLFDGAFLPAPLHGEYFAGLNIPRERQAYPVDVVESVGALRAVGAGPGTSEPYLLFVGRCLPRKRLDVLLQALATPALRQQRRVVIGDGPAAADWRRLAEGLGLDGRVDWLGSLPNDQARAWLNGALGLAIPSDFEQWGLVANEAWQAGVPVLGSDSVGALRASYPLEWSWMMPPPGDVPAWRSALGRLLAMTPAERAGMAERLALLAERYSLGAHAGATLELAALPLRERPPAWVSRLALAWPGRVAVY